MYVADIGETTQLFVRLINEFQASPIPGTEGAFCPFFSPDSRRVGFFTKDKLKKVSLLGGDPVALCDASSPRGGNWGTDGTITFVENQGGGLTQVLAASGATAPLIAGTNNLRKTRMVVQRFCPAGNGYFFPPEETVILNLSLRKRER